MRDPDVVRREKEQLEFVVRLGAADFEREIQKLSEGQLHILLKHFKNRPTRIAAITRRLDFVKNRATSTYE